MSVIVRDEEGQILLFCKGADRSVSLASSPLILGFPNIRSLSFGTCMHTPHIVF